MGKNVLPVAGDEIARLVQPGYREASLVFARRAAPLYAMITSAGYQLGRHQTYDWHGLRRGNAEFALLQYTLEGEGMLAYEGREMRVSPGTAMLLHFPHDNRYWLPEGGRWAFFYVCLNGRDVLRHWRSLVAKAGPLVALGSTTSGVRAAAAACHAVLGRDIASPFAASSLAYAMTMALLDDCMPAAPIREPPAFVDRVVRFCRSSLARPIGVDEMADAAGLSRYHFSRRFQQARGVSPARFLAELRMQEAVRLIQTNLPVREVARRCGFRDPNYFCKAFRRSFGVSPGAFGRSGMYST
jgi:AraC-like DNA-binding protein